MVHSISTVNMVAKSTRKTRKNAHKKHSETQEHTMPARTRSEACAEIAAYVAPLHALSVPSAS